MGDKPALRPGEPVGAALTAIAHETVAEARTALADIDRGSAVAVHSYRKAMKRWRAVLRLLEPFLGPEGHQLRMAARDLARQLAGARDQQAALDALKDLDEAELGLPKTSVGTMRGRLEEARLATELTTLTAELRDQLQAALAGAGQAVDAWLLQDVSFPDVAGEIARHYRRARRAIPAAWAETGAEALHQLRQRVVEHRYQMELIEPVWPRFGKLWVAEAQRLRERLGSHQDLVVLGNLTAPHQLLAPWRSRLTLPIEQRRAAHVAGSRRLALRLFAERPRAFRRRLEALWEGAGD